MQMDVYKPLYHFHATKKMPHVTATVTKKCASLIVIVRYITIIYIRVHLFVIAGRITFIFMNYGR